jgi:arsenate reductase
MAEGLTNHFFGDKWEAFSAGTEATFVKPHAIKVLEEIGIDISAHRSKLSTEFKDINFDVIVTVCDNAKENCPYFPGAENYIHHSFNDPSDSKGSEEKILLSFKNSRNEIKKWLDKILG